MLEYFKNVQKVADQETPIEDFEDYALVDAFKPKPGAGVVGFVSLLQICY